MANISKTKQAKPDYNLTTPIFLAGRIFVFFNEDNFRLWVEQETSHPIEKLNNIDGYSMQVEIKEKDYFSIYVNPECIETIYHECLHISWFILEHHNVSVDCSNHEILAYLQGYLAEEIAKLSLKYLKKQEGNNGQTN